MSSDSQQRYRVVERLAAGGMAEVFLAESAGIEGFKKRVAIKRVLPHLSEKKRFIAMFLDEARLSANFSHSNVVQVFDIGVGDNTYFIVMEYVDGADLKAVMADLNNNNRQFPIEAALLICGKICEGLGYAHEQTTSDGVPLNAVHRDMSPPNVLISKHGEVKIVDFGLAKASTQLEKSEAGIIKGKFHYLSPEAAHGKEVNQQADIFAVGIILWEMLAGRRLFSGESDYQVVKAVQRCEVPRISKVNPEVSAEVESILARSLARDPSQRYQTARALALDLTRCLFRLGRPVDAFTLSELVRGPMMGRNVSEGAGASIIERLIQETLFEFTSLKDDSKAAKAAPKKEDFSRPFPLSGFDFEDFGRLADLTKRAAQRHSKSPDALPQYEEGNLAALEGPEAVPPSPDDTATLLAADPGSPAPGLAEALEDGPGATDAGRRSGEVAVGSGRASGPRSGVVSSRGERSSGGGTALKLVVVVLVAAGTAAALYFSGLL
jgi:serine/threonine protein kinase